MLYGIVAFDEFVVCAPIVLGHREAISIGGIDGFLEFPTLPDWSTKPNDPVHMPLTAPNPAKTWKRGDNPIVWGFPSHYHAGVSRVEKVLLEFPVDESVLTSSSNSVHRAFAQWRTLFFEYLELITKQRRIRNVRVLGSDDRLDFFCWDADGKLIRPYDSDPVQIFVRMSGEDTALNKEQLSRICAYCSTSIPPSLAYRMQLEAYRALRSGDQAIIESAAAAEIALTRAIKTEFHATAVSYGEKLLDKFRMLGGRVALAKIVGLQLPEDDYKSLLIEPRNNVIHCADFADEASAMRVVRL